MDEFGNTQQEFEKDMIIASIMLDGKTSYEEAERIAIEELKEIYETNEYKAACIADWEEYDNIEKERN